MNEIVIFTQNQTISYTAIVISIAVVTTVICAILTAASMRKSITAVMACSGISMIIAPLCSRFVYWYCVPEQFESFLHMFSGMNTGGYSLPGVIIGVALSAFITWKLHVTDDLLSLLDCLAPAAAAGIGIGRLSGFFSNDDKGNLVFKEEALQRFPLSVPVADKVTGVIEWRFASFVWESIAGFIIFAILIAMVLKGNTSKTTTENGDIFMVFLSLFGATQASLESTRYDALYMRSNGFISMMQMVALIMILVPVIFYTVKYIKSKAFASKGIVPLLVVWGVTIVSVGVAGVSEYFIQRKSGYALWIYPVQMLFLIFVYIMTFTLPQKIRAAETETETE